MEEKERRRIINSVDVIVALFIIILGIVLIIFSLSWGDYVNNTLYSTSMPDWIQTTTWIFFILSITTIFYGIKRLIHDLLP